MGNSNGVEVLNPDSLADPEHSSDPGTFTTNITVSPRYGYTTPPFGYLVTPKPASPSYVVTPRSDSSTTTNHSNKSATFFQAQERHPRIPPPKSQSSNRPTQAANTPSDQTSPHTFPLPSVDTLSQVATNRHRLFSNENVDEKLAAQDHEISAQRGARPAWLEEDDNQNVDVAMQSQARTGEKLKANMKKSASLLEVGRKTHAAPAPVSHSSSQMKKMVTYNFDEVSKVQIEQSSILMPTTSAMVEEYHEYDENPTEKHYMDIDNQEHSQTKITDGYINEVGEEVHQSTDSSSKEHISERFPQMDAIYSVVNKDSIFHKTGIAQNTKNPPSEGNLCRKCSKCSEYLDGQHLENHCHDICNSKSNAFSNEQEKDEMFDCADSLPPPPSFLLHSDGETASRNIPTPPPPPPVLAMSRNVDSTIPEPPPWPPVKNLMNPSHSGEKDMTSKPEANGWEETTPATHVEAFEMDASKYNNNVKDACQANSDGPNKSNAFEGKNDNGHQANIFESLKEELCRAIDDRQKRECGMFTQNKKLMSSQEIFKAQLKQAYEDRESRKRKGAIKYRKLPAKQNFKREDRSDYSHVKDQQWKPEDDLTDGKMVDEDCNILTGRGNDDFYSYTSSKVSLQDHKSKGNISKVKQSMKDSFENIRKSVKNKIRRKSDARSISDAECVEMHDGSPISIKAIENRPIYAYHEENGELVLLPDYDTVIMTKDGRTFLESDLVCMNHGTKSLKDFHDKESVRHDREKEEERMEHQLDHVRRLSHGADEVQMQNDTPVKNRQVLALVSANPPSPPTPFKDGAPPHRAKNQRGHSVSGLSHPAKVEELQAYSLDRYLHGKKKRKEPATAENRNRRMVVMKGMNYQQQAVNPLYVSDDEDDNEEGSEDTEVDSADEQADGSAVAQNDGLMDDKQEDDSGCHSQPSSNNTTPSPGMEKASGITILNVNPLNMYCSSPVPHAFQDNSENFLLSEGILKNMSSPSRLETSANAPGHSAQPVSSSPYQSGVASSQSPVESPIQINLSDEATTKPILCNEEPRPIGILFNKIRDDESNASFATSIPDKPVATVKPQYDAPSSSPVLNLFSSKHNETSQHDTSDYFVKSYNPVVLNTSIQSNNRVNLLQSPTAEFSGTPSGHQRSVLNSPSVVLLPASSQEGLFTPVSRVKDPHSPPTLAGGKVTGVQTLAVEGLNSSVLSSQYTPSWYQSAQTSSATHQHFMFSDSADKNSGSAQYVSQLRKGETSEFSPVFVLSKTDTQLCDTEKQRASHQDLVSYNQDPIQSHQNDKSLMKSYLDTSGDEPKGNITYSLKYSPQQQSTSPKTGEVVSLLGPHSLVHQPASSSLRPVTEAPVHTTTVFILDNEDEPEVVLDAKPLSVPHRMPQLHIPHQIQEMYGHEGLVAL